MKQAGSKKKSAEITLDELLAEMDKHRVRRVATEDLTEEQKKFLERGRDKALGAVSFPKLAEIWSKKWGAIKAGTLQAIYNRALEFGVIKGN